MRRSNKSAIQAAKYRALFDMRPALEEMLKYRTIELADRTWQAEIIGPMQSRFFGYTSISYRAEIALAKLSDQLATYGFIGQLKGQ
jgi:hypothetical protein